MKFIVLVVALLMSLGLSRLSAGTVVQLGNAPEAQGTLSLTATGIHVEGSSASDVNFSDILEAGFGDTPFHVTFFSSTSSPDQLPPEMKGQDIGHPSLPGATAYANGVLTLTGAGTELQRKEDQDEYYFFGIPMNGNGQFIAELERVEGDRTQAGPMIRQDLTDLSPHFSMGVGLEGGGLFRARYGNSGHAGWTGFDSAPPPVWVKMTCFGGSIDEATSTDGDKWEILSQGGLNLKSPWWLGFSLDTFSPKLSAKVALDHILVSNGPAESESLPPGVLLKSGSFIAGVYHMQGAAAGELDREGKKIALSPDQIAAVIIHPVSPRQIADVSDQTGVILKNGDFLASDIQGIDGGYITANSTELGIASYYADTCRACILHPAKAQASDYEVRLKDGSIIRAKGVNASTGQVVIAEISGPSIDATPDEIAQFRAGSAQVQSLMSLAWKAKAPTTAGNPTAASTPANAPPSTNAAPTVVVPVTGGPDSEVQSCSGPNQEQILVVPAGNSVEFPLSGKFSSIVLQAALTPDSPANSTGALRILVDGNEAGRTPDMKAGSGPSLIQLAVSSPKSVTIIADSTSTATKIFLIDPVAVRAK